jgi:hypothetical protein
MVVRQTRESARGPIARAYRCNNPRTIGQFRQGEMRMRRIILALVAAGWLSAGTGCLIPMYSADPARRAQELIYTSEDLRAFLDEWERIWFLDQPSHMTPLRTHGGII